MKEEKPAGPKETTGLLGKQEQAAEQEQEGDKKTSCCEKTAECCVEMPRPYNLFFQSKQERIFHKLIEDGTIISEDPALGYRADTRPPDEIFEDGFSAYSFKRALNRPKGDMEEMLCYCPCAWPIGMLWCLAQCFRLAPYYCSTSPGGWLGQNKYAGLYDSNWSALALSTVFHRAKSYYDLSRKEVYWRYLVYLPDGYVDFGEFCRILIERGIEEGSTSSNEYEVFPRGLQKIAGANIVAAVKFKSSLFGDSQTDEIMINKRFTKFYEFKDIVNQMIKSDEIFLRTDAGRVVKHVMDSKNIDLSDSPTTRMMTRSLLG